jgi:hypothetical protein
MKTVKSSLHSLIKEHTHLVKVLKTGSYRERLKEAKDQAKELGEYTKKRNFG